MDSKKKEYSTSELDALLADDVKPKAANGKEATSSNQTQSGKLLEIISASGANFFHTEHNEPFVSIPQNGHCEIYGLGSKAFRAWLAGQYYTAVGKPIGNNAINEAILHLRSLNESVRIPSSAITSVLPQSARPREVL